MNISKSFAVTVVAAMLSVSALAQESASVFSFLDLPVSAHAVAIGGQGTAIISDDASLITLNPALMMSAEKKSINLNFTTYMQGMKLGGANYVQPSGDEGAWGVSAQFLSYGSTYETDVEGNVLGEFTPLDLMIGGGYSRVLGERWVAGASGKFIYSGYGSLKSVALGIDAGINYYNEDSETSLSLTMRNVGVQLKGFGDHRERLPMLVELGYAQSLRNTPLTLYVTLSDLNHWNRRDFSSREGETASVGKMLVNHFILGVDARIAKIMRLSLGYNFRRAYDLSTYDGEHYSSHGAGLSLGAGLYLKKFMLGVSWAKYHVSTSSLAITAQYNL